MQIFICDTHNASWEKIEKAAALLPPQRLAKAQSCRSKEAYLDKVVGFWLVHYALSRYNPALKVQDWCVSETGKPYLENSALHFSLSHTQGCIAVAVDNAPVGIDVQKIVPHPHGFAKRWFSEDEQALVVSSTEPDAAICRIFCAKEAAAKRSGTGLCQGICEIDISDTATTHLTLTGGEYVLAVAPCHTLSEIQAPSLLQILP